MKKAIVLALLLVSCSDETNIKVLEGKEKRIGMKAYERCEQAPKYLIFPDPSPRFTMKGVRFPVRIIAFKNGEVVHNRIHYPDEALIRLPNPDLVIEVPVCDREQYSK
ncbi:hypothetical protein BCF55_0988 [Hydrogenivirga caldilitoris]|uniref:Uncharacterized protein n=1 Tax=Hydrogenivirga caldilitoris TaxID=246264 RepID=A0A497XP29_9AQUI|nr:hypothetical protein [Hydrogenivirga caldilitoris]RLJ70707.1 hypothetical protein BCF55_0988 [Hydrogenivirga caldilitoris]